MVPGPYATQKALLLLRIADAMRSRGLYWPTHTSAKRVVLYGYGSDLERVELLYTSLLVQMSHELARQQVPRGESTTSFRTSWLIAYRRRIFKRLKAHEQRAAEQAAADNGTGMELVLASRSDMAQKMMKDANPTTRTHKPTVRSRSGLIAGNAAADRADIGVTKVDRSTTRGLPAGG